jgi:D-alanyl-D-alanine carboxypeptidase/D-alanyl-D-alanine-endopeptidase (penicillin-binding protein 4)
VRITGPLKRILHAVVVLIGVLLLARQARADLAGDINKLLSDKLLAKGEIGLEVMRLGGSAHDSQVIYQFKGSTPRVPASNLKLTTTSTALDKLGPAFEFKTVFARRGSDVALIGDGDPTLGDVEMLRKLGWDVDTVFKAWAQLLKSRGINEVHNVYVDDSIFDQNFVHPNWPVEQQHKRYVAQVGGVNLNANCVDFYLTTGGIGDIVSYRAEPSTRYTLIQNTCVTGTTNAVWFSRKLGTNSVILRGETNVSNDEPISVTINDPPMFAATVLEEVIESSGIRVTGEVLRDRTIRQNLSIGPSPTSAPLADRWVAMAIHATPLSSVLARANKDSMNLYAECLCKRLGAFTTGTSGSWQNGTAAVGGFLKSIGLGDSDFSLDDGCGLSKKNVISPHAVVTLLEHNNYSSYKDAFVSSLAVAATDGTMKDRFRDSDLKGRVFGKSGYVVGVRSLSGYLKCRDGQWYAFSILFNGLPESDYGVKPLQEKIVQAVDAANRNARVAAGQ